MCSSRKWIFGVKLALVKEAQRCLTHPAGQGLPALPLCSVLTAVSSCEQLHLTFPSSTLSPHRLRVTGPLQGTIHSAVSGADWEIWLNNTRSWMSGCEVLTHSWSCSTIWQADVACPSCFCRKMQVSCSLATDLVAHHGLLSYPRTF